MTGFLSSMLLFAALAPSSEPDRTHQPPPAPETSWQAPVPTRFRALGLDGYLIERHEVPIVELSIIWNMGDVLDSPKKAGMHAMCTDLVGEATKSLDKLALEDKKADLGAVINIGAGRETGRLNLKVVKERLPGALDIVAQLLLEPALAKDDLERLRAQRKAAVLQERGSADSIGARVLAPVLYGQQHPYGHLVTEKTLDAITRDDCASVAGELKPDGARIIAVGDVTASELEQLLSARLSAWKGKAPQAPRINKGKPAKGTLFFVDVPGAAQSRITVAQPGPPRTAADYYATAIMTQVLGQGMSSRLMQNLREKNGYTYGISAGIGYSRASSTLQVSSSVRTDVTGASLREVAREMRGISTRSPSDDEVKRERLGTIGALPGRFSTGSRALSSFNELLFFDLPLDTWAKLPADVSAVSTDAVKKAVADHLRVDGVTVIVAGDKAMVFADLQAIATEGLFGKDGLVVLDADGNVLR